MDWNESIDSFSFYQQLERAYSHHTIEAYRRDLLKLADFMQYNYASEINTLKDIEFNHLSDFVQFFGGQEFSNATQARMVSVIRSYFKYLIIEDWISSNPAELLEMPRLDSNLPDILTEGEVDDLIESIKKTPRNQQRNRVIVECLYSCGLRVSELSKLKISNLKLNKDYIKIEGKGKKERLVPVSPDLKTALKTYIKESRKMTKVAAGFEDYVLLNRDGKRLSRIMIFNIIKKLALQAGILKTISPHTFRHTFATHLVENGADLRVVQELLGHESIITTEIYTHLSIEHLRNAIENFHPRNKH